MEGPLMRMELSLIGSLQPNLAWSAAASSSSVFGYIILSQPVHAAASLSVHCGISIREKWKEGERGKRALIRVGERERERAQTGVPNSGSHFN
jgi:hypothetical protein